MLGERAAGAGILPIGVVIGALLVRRGEAVDRELGIGLDGAAGVDHGAGQARHIGVAADEVVAEEDRALRTLVARPAAARRQRPAVAIERLRRAGLAEVLLHVAGLAVALEARIEIPVARTVGVPAARPLGVG